MDRGSPGPHLCAFTSLTPLVLTILVGLLTAVHLYYALHSGMVPSTDEAHYMSGALSIKNGIRSGTWAGAWLGYADALIYKPPLVCVPAALAMLIAGGIVLPCMLSLVATFATLAFASYRLFRKCVTPQSAAVATLLLITTPLVTGLTHRFYVELLLLLISVSYLAVLARGPWASWRWSGAVGVLLGLGVLTKITFLPLVALPTIWSLTAAALPVSGWVKRSGRIAIRVLFASAMGASLAAPWYSRNLQSVLHHSEIAASCRECYFRHWFLADIGSGPGMLLASAGLIGAAFLVRAILARSFERQVLDVWIMILLQAGVTVVAITATVNKATRLQVTWLPAIALLAVAPIMFLPRRMRTPAGAILVVFSTIVSLHISFGFNFLPLIRFGELRVLDSHYPLNVPGWFDDNHPLDRRSYPLTEVASIIARDAIPLLNTGAAVHVRTVELGLLINHDYLRVLSAARHENIDYSWWPGSSANGPDAPDYIVHTRGFGFLYPGVHYFEYYPTLEADVASGHLPYQLFQTLEGPAGSAVLIYRKIRLTSKSQAATRLGAICIEAEAFRKGTVTIDTGQYGYGYGIGIILSPRPPVFAEYDLQIQNPSSYQLEVRYASAVSRPVRILMDGTLLTNRAAEAATGGFGPPHQQWQPVGIIPLNRGPHKMRLETDSLLPHIDQFCLVPIPLEKKL